RVYPVNPAVAEIDGHRAYATLADIPEPVDIVNIFRRSEFLPTIVDEAIAIHAKMIWAQLGIFHNMSAQRAIAAGLDVVMDACIKVDYSRLNVQRK
ncbi:MAG TPA: CoA-binding protein, partial [Chroococcidiopsis sp.]